jgi:hypothetical protein
MSTLRGKPKSEPIERKGPKLTRKKTLPEILGLQPKTESKKSAKGEVPLSGLCAHCVNGPECTYPRDSERPTMFCNEFTGYEPRKPAVITPIKEAVRQCDVAEQENAADQPALYKGLCRSCANRNGCTFPKPEGGVWRCEEYK